MQDVKKVLDPKRKRIRFRIKETYDANWLLKKSYNSDWEEEARTDNSNRLKFAWFTTVAWKKLRRKSHVKAEEL